MIDGIPACADNETMNGIARDVWGFNGAIVSDCGAAKAVWQTDHFTNSSEAVCPLTLNAGMDCACSNDLMPLQCAAPAIADGSLALGAVLSLVEGVASRVANPMTPRGWKDKAM
jgi:beta-glucosidase-like glycosyl hydrolase